jgi:ELWxxDGT repeat protein
MFRFQKHSSSRVKKSAFYRKHSYRRPLALEALEDRRLLSGTPQLLKDIDLGAGSSPGSEEIVEVNGTVFFVADDQVHGWELWKSDGTSEGTVLVKDVWAGGGHSAIRFLTNVDGTLFFTADDGTHGFELWKSDGTSEGTVMVKDIRVGNSSAFPQGLTDFNGTLYFSADDGVLGHELWKSDGTEAGTVLVKDVNPGFRSGVGAGFVNVNGTLFFSATTLTRGQELWKTDGTTNGTVLVKDIRTGSAGSNLNHLTNLNGVLVFVAADGTNTIEIDGTLFPATEIWRRDGTASGTFKVIGFGAFVLPRDLTVANGMLHFTAESAIGRELWISDGTAIGTGVADILPGFGSSDPSRLTNFHGTLYFTADDGTSGRELWKSDGSTVMLVKEIRVGSASTPISGNLAAANNALYFTADDGIHGAELWATNGTADGTALAADIRPGSGSSIPSNLIFANQSLFFFADDGVVGTEPWVLVLGNRAPVLARPISSVVVDEGAPDTVLDLSSVFSDPENEGSLTLSVVHNTNPALVSATLVDTSLTLSYLANHGSSRITIRATDVQGASRDASFLVTVKPVNSKPVANNQSVAAADDGTTLVTLTGSDVETAEANLRLSIISLPTSGVLTYQGNVLRQDPNEFFIYIDDALHSPAVFSGPPTLTYEPNFGLDPGSLDSFAFVVNDRGDPDNDQTGAPLKFSDLGFVNIQLVPAIGSAQVTIDATGVVRIGGTSADDDIRVASSGGGQFLKVTVNGNVVRDDISLGEVTEIRAWGRAGSDRIEVMDLAINSLIFGGEGDDEVIGAAGDDLIFGGNGSDQLTGAAGNDFLIGDVGADRIVGSAGHDVLVAGSVASHLTRDDLLLIAQQWAADRTADNSTSGEPVDEVLGGFDMLTGSSGADWFIATLNDKITDFKKQNKDGDVLTHV